MGGGPLLFVLLLNVLCRKKTSVLSSKAGLVTVEAPGPVMTAVKLSEDGGITIVFDQNIRQIVESCADVFDQETMDKVMGEDAKCWAKTNKLRVKGAAKAEPGTALRLKADNKILLAGSQDSYGESTKAKTITLPKAKVKNSKGRKGKVRKDSKV